MRAKKQQLAFKVTKPSKAPKGKSKKANIASGDESAPMPKPPPRLFLNTPLKNKILQVVQFITEGKGPQRDADEPDHLSVPESALISALMIMRIHYQVGTQEDASTADAENVIVGRFQQPIGHGPVIDWVTIDVTRRCQLANVIYHKIKGYGLDEVNLLHIELDMFRKRQMEGAMTEEEKLAEIRSQGWDPERFVRTFNEIWKRISVTETDGGAPEHLSNERDETLDQNDSVLDSDEPCGTNGAGTGHPEGKAHIKIESGDERPIKAEAIDTTEDAGRSCNQNAIEGQTVDGVKLEDA